MGIVSIPRCGGRREGRRVRALALFVGWAAALALGCASARSVPDPAPAADAARGNPVVIVPGLTGTELRDRQTGRRVWGDGRSLLLPRDGGHALALPIAGGESRGREVEAGEVIERVRLLGVIRKPIYGPIARLLEEAGYRRGDLDEPRPEDGFFLFAYDWRRDSTVSARRLLERLEGLRRVRGEARLDVDLVCQSGGAHLCRYLAKYAGATLEEAEAGGAGPPQAVRIAKLVLVGTSNGGSMRMLRWLDRGRRYVPGVGRRFRPETLFTFPATFEDLPGYLDDPVLDERGEPLDVDLFDPAAWERHGWSVFGEGPRRRLERGRRADLFGDAPARRRHLARMLDRARRFQRLLARDVPDFDTRYYSIQNVGEETPERAVLVPGKGGRRRLLFTGDRALRRRPALHARATALGDEHATVASQGWLSPQELASFGREPLAVAGGHFELILEPEARAALLAYLSE